MPEPAPAAGAALQQALREFAGAPAVLIALDFDGCLAPFVLDPADARPLPQSSTALADLARVPGTHLALVSGRPVADLNRLAAPPPHTRLVGSHGAEEAEVDAAGTARIHPLDLTTQQQATLRAVTGAVEQLAEQHPPAWVEHKPAAAVLHTRALPGPQAEALLAEAMSGPGQWEGVHAISGNQVVELAVVDATKGQSLQRLRRQVRPAAGGPGQLPVLYAGDDVTDETALEVLGRDDVGIKVGEAPTVAPYRVSDEQAVAEVLTQLALWRTSLPTL